MLVFLSFHRRTRWPALAGLFLAVVVSTAMVAKMRGSQGRFSQVDRILQGADDEMRLKIWPAAWKIWQTSPWMGVGPGHFDFHYPQFGNAHYQTRPNRVHNDYLNTLVDWGGVGLACLLTLAATLFATFFRHGWTGLAQGVSPDRTESHRLAWVVGALFGLVGLGLHSFADFNLHIPANALTLAAITGMALGFVQERRSNEAPLRTGVPLAYGLVFVLLATPLGAQAWFLSRESSLIKRTTMVADFDARMAALRTAHEYAPLNFEITNLIAEELRVRSFRGDPGYEELAHQAIGYYESTIALNRFHWEAHAKIGMCLDWLGEHQKAEGRFQTARALNIYSARLMAFYGWHLFQLEKYDEAANWFGQAQFYSKGTNELAAFYLQQIAERQQVAR